MRVDDQSGDLVLRTTNGSEMRQVRPKVYQHTGNQRVEVAGAYKLLGARHIAFALAAYDYLHPLVIDPSLQIIPYLGNQSEGQAIGVDRDGNSWMTDSTNINVPVTDVAAVLIGTIAGIVLSPRMLRRPIAVSLIGLGIMRCFRHLHPRWAWMRVGLGGLTWWSFLMASANRAGLMLLPLFLAMTTPEGTTCHTYTSARQTGLGGAATLRARRRGISRRNSRRGLVCR